MRQQSYLVRKGAKYHFRRRIRHQATSRPISISLGTADPEKARCLARRLAVKWDEVEMSIETVAQRQNLTVDEQRAIYRAALEKVIGLAIGDLVAPKKYRGEEPGMERIMAGYYAALLQVRADAEDVPDEIIDAAMRDEWNEEERDLVRKMLAAFGIPDEARASAGEAALKEIGAPITETTIHEARANVLRGMMEAHKRAELFNHPLIAAVGDPFAALLDDGLVLEARRTQLAEAGRQVTSTAPAAASRIYLNPSEKRFSEIIGSTLQALKADNKWKGDLRQRTAIAERFAWVTGDKSLCDYTDADIQDYVKALRLIPNDIRYGRLGKSGRLAKPYDPAVLPEVTDENRRDDRSINRDLSTLQSISKRLARNEWRSWFGKDTLEMNFLEHWIPIEDDPRDPKRMPWTPEHLRVLFSLPLWHGSGGSTKRLKIVERPQIYQDSAYWVPLIAIYTGMSREEVCGLEIIDFDFDCDVPYLLVQANMTRSDDGVTPGGLKRKSRDRVMPIHPELLRLGLKDYVECIAAQEGFLDPEQVIPIFPELYRDDAKRPTSIPKDELVAPETGGGRFYSRAWMGIVDATHAIMPLPETRSGKKADFHSTRTYTQSVLASPEVSQTLIDRIMGHAAKGTGPRKYNRRALAVGEVKALQELLDLLVKEMPVVTERVHRPASVNILHLKHRSRVGSAPGRDVSRYFLWDQDVIAKDKLTLAEQRKLARSGG